MGRHRPTHFAIIAQWMDAYFGGFARPWRIADPSFWKRPTYQARTEKNDDDDGGRYTSKAKEETRADLSVNRLAANVCFTLSEGLGIKSVDALVGYSLGGRVALLMKRSGLLPATSTSSSETLKVCTSSLVNDVTKLILISTYPGEIPGEQISDGMYPSRETQGRVLKDDALSNKMTKIFDGLTLTDESQHERKLHWANFLEDWYGAPLWGDLKENKECYADMVERRIELLSYRVSDMAQVL